MWPESQRIYLIKNTVIGRFNDFIKHLSDLPC